MKEIKFTPNTQLHDVKHKISKIPLYFKEGEKVKLTVRFSGRELNHPETGIKLLEQISAMIPNSMVEKSSLNLENKSIHVILTKNTK